MSKNRADSSPSTEHKIEHLWAIQEIKNLAVTYSYAVDSRDWDLFETLWTEDEPPSDHLLNIHSARGMRDLFKNAGASTLFVANHMIELKDADHAHGLVYCHCMMEWKIFFEQAILYKDNYVRQNGRWLFRNRDHLLWWGREWQQNPMKTRPSFFPTSLDDWPDCQVGAGVAFDAIRRDRSAS